MRPAPTRSSVQLVWCSARLHAMSCALSVCQSIFFPAPFELLKQTSKMASHKAGGLHVPALYLLDCCSQQQQLHVSLAWLTSIFGPACVLQAALHWTKQQEEDILHLRRLFYCKLGQLARQRATLVAHLSKVSEPSHSKPIKVHSLDINETADTAEATKSLADQLCANRAEEAWTFMRYGLSFLLRVGCCRACQQTLSVHSFLRHCMAFLDDVSSCDCRWLVQFAKAAQVCPAMHPFAA